MPKGKGTYGTKKGRPKKTDPNYDKLPWKTKQRYDLMIEKVQQERKKKKKK